MALSELSEEEKRLIEDQLELILSSTYFQSAKQMGRFLQYVVKKTLSGQGHQLKQYTIAVEALSFPDDFDSDSNPVIRIVAGRVRNRLRDFYENTNNNNTVINIPKGTYTPEFEQLEIKEQNVVSNDDLRISSGPTLALLSYPDKTQSKISNLLLLQTTDMLAEECSHFVMFNLTVHNPIADKSESHKVRIEIEADYFLSLYVNKKPNKQYELVCRLGNIGSEIIYWSESYDLKTNVAITEQKEVISKILAVIADIQQGKLHTYWARSLLLNKETIPNEYKAIVFYRQYYDDFSINAFEEAISVCEVALGKNPNDIIANILFSDLCRRDYVHGYDRIDSPLKRGVECAERVIHLRPDSTLGHFTLAQLLFSQGEWDRSIDALYIARSASSAHAVIQFGCGYYLCLMEKWDKGLLLINKAMSLSNSYPSWYYKPLFLYLYTQGKYQEALIEAKKIVAPNLPQGPLARCVSYAQLGQFDKATEELKELFKRVPDMEKNGLKVLSRLYGNEEIAKKISKGLELAIKGQRSID